MDSARCLGLHINDDVSLLPTGFDVPVRLDDLGEREVPVDDRPDAAIRGKASEERQRVISRARWEPDADRRPACGLIAGGRGARGDGCGAARTSGLFLVSRDGASTGIGCLRFPIKSSARVCRSSKTSAQRQDVPWLSIMECGLAAAPVLQDP